MRARTHALLYLSLIIRTSILSRSFCQLTLFLLLFWYIICVLQALLGLKIIKPGYVRSSDIPAAKYSSLLSLENSDMEGMSLHLSASCPLPSAATDGPGIGDGVVVEELEVDDAAET